MNSGLSLPRALILSALMFIAAGLAVVMTPRQEAGESSESVNLDSLFPREFGHWRSSDDALPPIVADAAESDAAGRIYAQVLNRTYVNQRGDQVLITLAYGGNQSDSLAIHRPEICYAAEGFHVMPVHDRVLTVDGKTIVAKVLAAQLGARYEPITYWFVIGGHVATGRLQRKFEQIRYGLSGKIPDGMLVRVSSIEEDGADAFAKHEAFINDLYLALDPEGRRRLVGAVSDGDSGH